MSHSRGKLLIRNYRVLRLLGKGGEGEVHLGKHLHTGELAAIKLLRPLGKGSDLHNFMEEANFYLHCTHPNLAKILDVGITQDNRPFIISTYYPQGEVSPGTLSLDQVIKYGLQLSSALAHIHSNHYIHRDVKDRNVLIDSGGNAILCDFGVVTLSNTYVPDQAQQPIGTPAYMAPEQFLGLASSASDQYSLAVLLYYLHFGQLPIQANPSTTEEWYNAHQNTPVQIVALLDSLEVNALDFRPFFQALEKALSKKPEDRYQNMEQFSQALERAKKAYDRSQVTTLKAYEIDTVAIVTSLEQSERERFFLVHRLKQAEAECLNFRRSSEQLGIQLQQQNIQYQEETNGLQTKLAEELAKNESTLKLLEERERRLNNTVQDLEIMRRDKVKLEGEVGTLHEKESDLERQFAELRSIIQRIQTEKKELEENERDARSESVHLREQLITSQLAMPSPSSLSKKNTIIGFQDTAKKDKQEQKKALKLDPYILIIISTAVAVILLLLSLSTDTFLHEYFVSILPITSTGEASWQQLQAHADRNHQIWIGKTTTDTLLVVGTSIEYTYKWLDQTYSADSDIYKGREVLRSGYGIVAIPEGATITSLKTSDSAVITYVPSEVYGDVIVYLEDNYYDYHNDRTLTEIHSPPWLFGL